MNQLIRSPIRENTYFPFIIEKCKTIIIMFLIQTSTEIFNYILTVCGAETFDL